MVIGAIIGGGLALKFLDVIPDEKKKEEKNMMRMKDKVKNSYRASLMKEKMKWKKELARDKMMRAEGLREMKKSRLYKVM